MSIQMIWRTACFALIAVAMAACETAPIEPETGPEPPSAETSPPTEPAFVSPPPGQFCVVNKTNVRITVAELRIKGFNPLFQGSLEPVSINGDEIVPVRKCFRYSELDQRDSIRAGEIVWLNISWSSFDMGGPDAVGKIGQNASKYAALCGYLDIKSDGVIEVEYRGSLRSDDDPDPKRAVCNRYDNDGKERTTVYGPQPAKWEGRPSCADRYPKTSEYNVAFPHRLTGKCYQCPAGFNRTAWDIDGDTACEKGGFIGIGAQHKRIHYAGPECGNPKSGRYNFRNGVAKQCYSCPAGWSKPDFGTVSFDLTEGNACTPPDWPY